MILEVQVNGAAHTTSSMTINCGAGNQTLKWLGTTVSQRAVSTQPRGVQRSCERSPMRGGFTPPGAVSMVGPVTGEMTVLDPHVKIKDVFQDGDTAFVDLQGSFTKKWVAELSVDEGKPCHTLFYRTAHTNAGRAAHRKGVALPAIPSKTQEASGAHAADDSDDENPELFALPGFKPPKPRPEDEESIRVNTLQHKRKAMQFVYIMEGQMLLYNIFGIMEPEELALEIGAITTATLRRIDGGLASVLGPEAAEEASAAVHASLKATMPDLITVFKQYCGRSYTTEVSMATLSFSGLLELIQECSVAHTAVGKASVSKESALVQALFMVKYKGNPLSTDKRRRLQEATERRAIVTKSAFRFHEFVEVLFWLSAFSADLEFPIHDDVNNTLRQLVMVVPAEMTEAEVLARATLTDLNVQSSLHDALPDLAIVHRLYSTPAPAKYEDGSIRPQGMVGGRKKSMDSGNNRPAVPVHDFLLLMSDLHHCGGLPAAPQTEGAPITQAQALTAVACALYLTIEEAPEGHAMLGGVLEPDALLYSEWLEALIRVAVAASMNEDVQKKQQNGGGVSAEKRWMVARRRTKQVGDIKRKLTRLLEGMKWIAEQYKQSEATQADAGINANVVVNRRGSMLKINSNEPNSPSAERVYGY
jgi:hypothetical protein